MDRDDEPSHRSYPANITIIQQLYSTLDISSTGLHSALHRHTINLIIVAFYWLLRPAEYTETAEQDGRSQADRLCDVQFTIGQTAWEAATPDLPLNDANDVLALKAASVRFVDQKNAVKGEQIHHTSTKDEALCPFKALGRIVLHLRKHNAPLDSPLYRHYNQNNKRWYAVKSTHITSALRKAAAKVQPYTGIDPQLLSARSLRPGGATSLLCANVDPDRIMLLGRWKSDAMFRYLRAQVTTSGLAQKMLKHGIFTFHPQTYVDSGLPNQAPPAVRDLYELDLYD